MDLPTLLKELTTRFQSQVSEERIRTWAHKLIRYHASIGSKTLAQSQCDEILHYLTAKDIEDNVIPRDPELRYVRQLPAEHDLDETFSLQSPEITFGGGEKPAGVKCKNPNGCPSMDTSVVPKQVRSIDEPTSYYYQCRTCGWQFRVG